MRNLSFEMISDICVFKPSRSQTPFYMRTSKFMTLGAIVAYSKVIQSNLALNKEQFFEICIKESM